MPKLPDKSKKPRGPLKRFIVTMETGEMAGMSYSCCGTDEKDAENWFIRNRWYGKPKPAGIRLSVKPAPIEQQPKKK